MKKTVCLLFVLFAFTGLFAQNGTADTTVTVKVTIKKDLRLDLLAKAEVDDADVLNNGSAM